MIPIPSRAETKFGDGAQPDGNLRASTAIAKPEKSETHSVSQMEPEEETKMKRALIEGEGLLNPSNRQPPSTRLGLDQTLAYPLISAPFGRHRALNPHSCPQ